MLLLLPLAATLAGTDPAPPAPAVVPVAAPILTAAVAGADVRAALPLVRLPSSVPALWVTGQPRSPDTGDASPDGRTVVWRADDGLFYVDGIVNGQATRFVIDTGASMIVLTAEDARRANIVPQGGAPVEAQTVRGKALLAPVTVASMTVGGTGVARVPAVVAQDGLSVSLLGQSWLSSLNSVTIEGDRMTLQ